ncbi:ATP-binding protein [Roseomonas sp. KE0001]|uniref:ATP-binding protein n=1 Tax=Roseomonas sp. KE0001 TaxID=2479201 RepID=UPI0018DF1DF5|nr:ATP-binding protein [Roseomonas sp. KE0001]
MLKVALPQSLDFASLMAFTYQWPSSTDELVIDLSGLRWIEPIGLVALSCLAENYRRGGGRIHLDHDRCGIAGYLERMGLFRELACEGPTPFGMAQPAAGRFAEIRKIEDINSVDDISENIVDVFGMEIGSNEWSILNHIITEALNNVCQHSGAHGFCAAQFWPTKDRLQICIGDWGNGIKHALAKYSPADDASALDLALKVGVTGNPPHFGQPQMRNRGVGLSCIERLVAANKGRMELWSGLGRRSTSSNAAYNGNMPWTGTLLMVNMSREGLKANFQQIMAELSEELRAVEKAGKPDRAKRGGWM